MIAISASFIDNAGMKASGVLLGSTLLLAGCSQAINYTYSKKNFTSPTFEVDLSACKHYKSSIAGYQSSPREQQAQLACSL